MAAAIRGKSALILMSTLVVGLALGSCGSNRTGSTPGLYMRLDQAGQSFDSAISVCPAAG